MLDQTQETDGAGLAEEEVRQIVANFLVAGSRFCDRRWQESPT